MQGGEIRFLGNQGRTPVPAGIDLREGQKVRLGTRPADLELDRGHRAHGDQGRASGWYGLSGEVFLAERLGRQVELDIHVDGQQLIVVEDSDHAPAEGDTVGVQINLANVHIFDGEAEEGLRLGSATGPGAAPMQPEAQQ